MNLNFKLKFILNLKRNEKCILFTFLIFFKIFIFLTNFTFITSFKDFLSINALFKLIIKLSFHYFQV